MLFIGFFPINSEKYNTSALLSLYRGNSRRTIDVYSTVYID